MRCSKRAMYFFSNANSFADLESSFTVVAMVMYAADGQSYCVIRSNSGVLYAQGVGRKTGSR